MLEENTKYLFKRNIRIQHSSDIDNICNSVYFLAIVYSSHDLLMKPETIPSRTVPSV